MGRMLLEWGESAWKYSKWLRQLVFFLLFFCLLSLFLTAYMRSTGICTYIPYVHLLYGVIHYPVEYGESATKTSIDRTQCLPSPSADQLDILREIAQPNTLRVPETALCTIQRQPL